MLHGLLLNTYREFIQALKLHAEFLPAIDLIDNDVIDNALQENRPPSHRIQV